MIKQRLSFDIINLMLVSGVIIIVAILSTGVYINFLTSAKLAEILFLASSAKNAVSEAYHVHGKFPTSNAQAELPESISSTNIHSIQVTNGGKIIITINFAGISNAHLTLTPELTERKIIWHCSSDQRLTMQTVPDC